MLDGPAMRRLADWCRGRGVRLISDEIYHGIGYGMRPVTALEADPDAVIINSFSKYFSMTGWRVGWMVVPPDLLRSVRSERRRVGEECVSTCGTRCVRCN